MMLRLQCYHYHLYGFVCCLNLTLTFQSLPKKMFSNQMNRTMQMCQASPGPRAGRGLLTTGLEDRLRGPCSITDPPLNAFLDTSTGTWPIRLPFVQMKLRRLRYRRRNPDDDGGGCGRVSRGRIPSDRSAGRS